MGKKSRIDNALRSSTPAGSLYSMISESKRDEFFKFASFFGFTRESIERILERERRRS